MKLDLIPTKFSIDSGAPEPRVEYSDNELIISFNVLSKENESNSRRSCIIPFCIYYSAGLPNDESLLFHPYYEYGLRSSEFFEVINSELILKLEGVEKKHPYYSSEYWKMYRHFIISFKDIMIEFIAKDYYFE